jgi:hypothetical protein
MASGVACLRRRSSVLAYGMWSISPTRQTREIEFHFPIHGFFLVGVVSMFKMFGFEKE